MQKTILVLSLILAFTVAKDFSSAAYQAQTRDQKLQQLHESITADQTTGSFPSALELLGIFRASMKVTLGYDADTLPEGRRKFIHCVGSVAKVEFVPEANTPYTGLFQGADSAIIRLSVAKKPDYTKTTAKQAFDNFTPGISLKFLVDGLPSANLVAMFGVNGVDTWNFFGRDFSNHIGGAQGLALTLVAQKFSEATDNVQTVGLNEFATHDQQGRVVENPQFPWRLVFRAPDFIKSLFSDDFKLDFQEQLKGIPTGTVLYDVYAIKDPSQACEEKIGSLKLVSQLLPSKFGDEQLFFKHQNMANDLEVYPQFSDYTPFWSLFGNRDAKKQEVKCPFSSLF